jgi:prevent-host-death family protein
MPGAHTKPDASPLAPAREMSVADAKAHFSSMISGVEKQHAPVTILRRGVPVAQVIPFPGTPTPRLRGSMSGTVRVLGDIVSPTGEEWTLSDE